MKNESYLCFFIIFTSGFCAVAALSDESPSVTSPFIDNATLDGKLRTVYYDVENTEKDSTAGAWAGGLWINLRSGYLADIAGVGASFYGVTKLYQPKGNTSSYQLLNDDNKGFSKLGQAYLEIKSPSTYKNRSASFVVGRREFRSGLISASSSRTVPSTWSGFQLNGAIENLKVGGALVNQISLRNQAGFHDLNNFSGQKIDYIIGAEITYVLPLVNEREFRFRYRNAFAKDFLQAHNGDILFTTPAGLNRKIKLGVSYYQSQKDGDLWQGKGRGGSPLFDDKASVINVHGDLIAGAWHFRAGVSHFRAPSSVKSSVSGYTQPGVYYYDLGANTHGAWDIGTSGFAENMLYDGETAWMTGVAYSFSESVFKGLEVGYAFHYGSGMKVGIPEGRKKSVAEREHDIYLIYAFPETVLAGLKFKLKYGHYQNDRALRKAIQKEEQDLRVWLDYNFLLF